MLRLLPALETRLGLCLNQSFIFRLQVFNPWDLQMHILKFVIFYWLLLTLTPQIQLHMSLADRFEKDLALV